MGPYRKGRKQPGRVNAKTLGRGCGPDHFLWEGVVVERIKNWADLSLCPISAV